MDRNKHPALKNNKVSKRKKKKQKYLGLYK